MIRLGLIGAGKWGKNYIDAVKEVGAEVKSVYGHDTTKNIPHWHLFLQEVCRYNGVIIATPPKPRCEIICELARCCIPMMVEKPLCLSLADAALICAALDPKVPFLVDYQHLFSPKYLSIRETLAGITPKVFCKARGPEVRSYSQLWDYGPHFLAMAMGLGAKLEDVELDFAVADEKMFEMRVEFPMGFSTEKLFYVGRTQRPLIHAVKAFVKAVEDGRTDDWRFGVEMSVEITRELERRSSVEKTVAIQNA